MRPIYIENCFLVLQQVVFTRVVLISSGLSNGTSVLQKIGSHHVTFKMSVRLKILQLFLYYILYMLYNWTLVLFSGNLYFANVLKSDENFGEEYTCEIQLRALNMYIEGAFTKIKVDNSGKVIKNIFIIRCLFVKNFKYKNDLEENILRIPCLFLLKWGSLPI